MDPRSALFENVSDRAVADIVALAHRTHRQPDESFFTEGEPAGHFFMLINGHVKFTRLTPAGEEITLRMLGPGGVFGAIDGLGIGSYAVSATAVEPSEVLVWTSDTMRRVLEGNGAIALNALRLTAGRLLDLQQRYCQSITESAERRVARALLRLVDVAGHPGERGIEVEFPVSRQDVAEMAGTSLFTVSRLLRAWERRGILRHEPRHICLLAPGALAAIAAGPTPPPRPL